MTVFDKLNFSTIVRIAVAKRLAFKGVRWSLRALEEASPSVASIAAESLFRRPTRHRRPQWERSVLDTATPLRVAHAGSTLPAWSWGDGPLVLLVHGWEGRGTQLSAHVAPLVRAGFRVVCFDAPGHGDAEGDRSSVIEIAQALRSVIDHFGAPHAIVAHSVGCVATAFALKRASLATRPRLVFYCPPISPRRFTEHFAKAMGLSEATRAAMAARIEERYGIALAELELLAVAEQREEPLLVIHDSDDKDVPVVAGRAVVSRWKGSQLVITEGLGHRRVLRDESAVRTAVDFVSEGAIERAPHATEEQALFCELFDRDERSAA